MLRVVWLGKKATSNDVTIEIACGRNLGIQLTTELFIP